MSKKRTKTADKKDNNRAADNLSEKLRQATKNLYYISETDAEMQPFIGRAATSVKKDDILIQTEKPTSVKVEERDFTQFFERLVTIRDWFGDEEKETAERFAVLRDLLANNLKDLKVFKVGEIELEIFIVGLDAQGNLVGVKTKAVET